MTSIVTTLAPAVGIADPGRVPDARSDRPDPQVPERSGVAGSPRSTSWRWSPPTTPRRTGIRAPCCAGKGCIPVTSSSGVKPVMPAGCRHLACRAAASPVTGMRIGSPSWSGQGAAGAGAGQGPLRGGCAGKTARALGDTLREHRHRPEVDAVTDAAVAELAPVVVSRFLNPNAIRAVSLISRFVPSVPALPIRVWSCARICGHQASTVSASRVASVRSAARTVSWKRCSRSAMVCRSPAASSIRSRSLTAQAAAISLVGSLSDAKVRSSRASACGESRFPARSSSRRLAQAGSFLRPRRPSCSRATR